MHTLRLRSVSRPAGRLPRTRRLRPFAGLLAGLLIAPLHAAQVVIEGPPGSGAFGYWVTILPNGNLVVIDPLFDAPGPVSDVGAVHLLRPDGTRISTLRGGSADDRIGSAGVAILSNGNFLVMSPNWDNGAAVDAGAVTFVSASAGLESVVTASNSLVGASAQDQVGDLGLMAFSNGNFLLPSPLWDNGGASDAGAITFGSGTTGVAGVISAANSLVGSTTGDSIGGGSIREISGDRFVARSAVWDNGAAVDAGVVVSGSTTQASVGVVTATRFLAGRSADDQIGNCGIEALADGGVVICSALWDNGAAADVGAVTFVPAGAALPTQIHAGNSLIGTTPGDRVGSGRIRLLDGGYYAIASPNWDHGSTADVGAVTVASGATGVVGALSPAGSLIGGTANDTVGSGGVQALLAGRFLVRSPNWDLGGVTNAGAVTFGVAGAAATGVVSPANSLVGSSAADQVGSRAATMLADGDYVVPSPNWDRDGVVNAGAVTFGSGATGIVGAVTTANSLVGESANDTVGGGGVTALAQGNYVVCSPNWDAGATADVGAATFGLGSTGVAGPVSAQNSLVGSRSGDRVGSASCAAALTQGNYVVRSPLWDNGPIADAGAATFGSGSTGIVGPVSAQNSLVGGSPADAVGLALPLADGAYFVVSQRWDDGARVDVGAVTHGSGTTGVTGLVSPTIALVGSTANDRIGDSGVFPLGDGYYLVRSQSWDNGDLGDAGAITLGRPGGGVVGAITGTNSVLGTVAGSGGTESTDFDPWRNQLVVGQRLANRVILYRIGAATSTRIVGAAPDPAPVGVAVTFTASVSSAPPLPTDGRVTFIAGSGESCFDATPTPTSPTSVDFSCAIAFTAPGTTNVVAEYTGSTIHAYSGSEPEAHTTIAGPLFADGFEGP